MGKTVAELISRQPDMELMGGVEVKGHPDVGKPLGKGKIVDDLWEIIENGDAVVEFAFPAATLKNLEVATQFNKPYIIGTTGFSEGELAGIKTISQKIPVISSPNFSIGVNLLFKLTEEAAKILGESFDVEIIEVHHNQKKDAPSGTAKKLAEILQKTKNIKKIVFGREGITGERSKDEIGVLSVRAGDVVGEHTVIFAQEGERLELVHRATSRLAFAQGVIKAVRFIIGKPPGLYGMDAIIL